MPNVLKYSCVVVNIKWNAKSFSMNECLSYKSSLTEFLGNSPIDFMVGLQRWWSRDEIQFSLLAVIHFKNVTYIYLSRFIQINDKKCCNVAKICRMNSEITTPIKETVIIEGSICPVKRWFFIYFFPFWRCSAIFDSWVTRNPD